jgi:hypothetical protein
MFDCKLIPVTLVLSRSIQTLIGGRASGVWIRGFGVMSSCGVPQNMPAAMCAQAKKLYLSENY